VSEGKYTHLKQGKKRKKAKPKFSENRRHLCTVPPGKSNELWGILGGATHITPPPNTRTAYIQLQSTRDKRPQSPWDQAFVVTASQPSLSLCPPVPAGAGHASSYHLREHNLQPWAKIARQQYKQ
jgi:hypothetical protein